MNLKKYTLIILLLIAMANLQAQDYLISFAGTGASAAVDSVKVENLTQGTKIKMAGNKVLHLLNTITEVDPVIQNKNSQISFSPNPMTDYSRMQFDLPEDGKTTITLCDISGRKIAEKQDLLSKGQHIYRLQGISNGIYFITINSNNYSISGKLVSSESTNSDIRIVYENTIMAQERKSLSKGTDEETAMQYNTGDRLKFTGISGIYGTVITDIPSSNKTITFNFIACTDGDNNNYPVVRIGTQVWMAENLKTTKDKEKTLIPDITDNTVWSNLNTPGLCWYENNAATYKDTYGALYNWYEVGTGKLCPTGWHVPSDEEWATLATFLGGESVAGNKLKETDGTHWYSPWYDPSKATNEFGFTALPGGARYDDGKFDALEFGGGWWSSTKIDVITAYGRPITYNSSTLLKAWGYKTEGYSIRCLGD